MDLRTLIVTTQQANGTWIAKVPELVTMWAKGATKELAIQQWLSEYDVLILRPIFEGIQQERIQAQWKDQAIWLHQQLPGMEFKVNNQHNTICTVWIDDDPNSDKFLRMGEILEKLFNAYMTGPMANWQDANHKVHLSFGFRSANLIEHARRVLPLPNDLQPGDPIYR